MNRRLFFVGLFYIAVLFSFSACDLFNNNGNDPGNKNKYLVSKTLVMTYPTVAVKTLMQGIEKAYSDAAGLTDNVKYGFFVYKVNYKTTYQNQEVIASGVVCVPIGTGSFPLLSFQNGTNTLHSKAPTEAIFDSLFVMIQSVSSFGFIVAMPDYLGFGASKTMYHPYLNKASTVQCVTDLYRAVKEMMKGYPTTILTKDTYLLGYSQGGWATMVLKNEMESNLSADFTLKATSCGAGPYDLSFVCNKILGQTTYPQPYFLAYMINSYIKSGEISLGYIDIFNSPYSGTNYISDLYDGTKDGDYINSKLSTSVPTLFTSDMINNLSSGSKFATLRTAMTNNSVGAWKTTSPTLLVHGLGDSFVTPEVSSRIYLDFLAKGTALDVVTYIPIPALGHSEAILPWGLLSIKWILEKKG
jgi:pimeloyl-ACP methyl ester carboxylesterase